MFIHIFISGYIRCSLFVLICSYNWITFSWVTGYNNGGTIKASAKKKKTKNLMEAILYASYDTICWIVKKNYENYTLSWRAEQHHYSNENTYGIQLYTKYRQKKAMSPDTHTAWLNVQLAPIKCVVYVRIRVLCFLDLFCFIQNLSLSLDSLWPCLLHCYKFYLLYCYNVQFKQQKLDAAHLKWARKRNSACLYGNYE